MDLIDQGPFAIRLVEFERYADRLAQFAARPLHIGQGLGPVNLRLPLSEKIQIFGPFRTWMVADLRLLDPDPGFDRPTREPLFSSNSDLMAGNRRILAMQSNLGSLTRNRIELLGKPMDYFEIKNGELFCEEVSLAEIAADVGTPAYVYSTGTMLRHADVLKSSLEGLENPLIAYAVKANPNPAVLATLASAGLGADVVSGGEIQRARTAGIAASKIVFSGVGKTEEEMCLALEQGVYQFNLESVAEAETLSALATSMGLTAPIAFRVNPDVSAGTHAKITTGIAESKFGIAIGEAPSAYAHVATFPGLSVQGVAVHIGSQLTALAPLERAFTRVGELLGQLRSQGFDLGIADLGGGLGVPYNPELPAPPSPMQYGKMVRRITRDWNVRLVFEPGRLIVGNAGVLLSRVVRIKPGAAHPFMIVDAGMNDLLRPALYDGWHQIDAVRPTGSSMGCERRRSSL